MKAFGLLAIMVVGLAAGASPPGQPRVTGIEEFGQRVAAYVALHRELERQSPPQALFTDAEPMLSATARLRDAIRAARPGAGDEDVFRPAARELRARIRWALREHGLEARELLAEMRDEDDAGGHPPMVNSVFSWAPGNVMPPCVIDALPPLPEELEYRLVGPHLVLLDIHANLVVDILRNVLPDSTATAK